MYNIKLSVGSGFCILHTVTKQQVRFRFFVFFLNEFLTDLKPIVKLRFVFKIILSNGSLFCSCTHKPSGLQEYG